MEALPETAVVAGATVTVVDVIVCVLRRESRKVDTILRDELGPLAEEPTSVSPTRTRNAADCAVQESEEMAPLPPKFPPVRAARPR
jgi:hypothetical protein